MTAPAYPAYRGLRYEEDRALELLLSGVTVPNAQGNPLTAAVIYRLPDREEVTTTYPYFLIDFIGIYPRRNEEHRGIVMYGMEPYTGNYLPGGGYTLGPTPIPITLRYQITVNSRVQQHDVILNDLCATTFFPIRFGQLNTLAGTARRLDFEGMHGIDTIGANKQKIYRKVWNIAISAEIMMPMEPVGAPVTEIEIELANATTDEPYETVYNR